ncbi:MAG: FG-GAP-like repeat-containing protein, partial [Candidatus Sumerlaeota bacterium]|nr:FG-GAP-like repeat-containing protein [Candidatus Sumerlaeota bacterium]
DGYADVIVGAPHYDDGGQNDEGRVFMYLGSASGLMTSATWTAESDQVGAQFGASVASAGDVNGDGYADVIVGAPTYDNDQIDEGRAYLYLGSATGLLPTASWTAESNQAGTGFGGSVATAGDINGDGYADVIVGATGYSNGENHEGRAFIYLGSPSGLAAGIAWTAESNQDSSGFGYCVATAGDINGDGYSDVIVGAPYYDNGETDEGRVFLYYGAGADVAPDQPANLSPANGAAGVSLTPTLQSSAFSDPDTSDTHKASQWQVRASTSLSDWSLTVFDSTTDTTHLTSITLATALDYTTTFFWRVRYCDNHGAWSAWSNPTSFTTVAAPPSPSPTPHPTPSATPHPTPYPTPSPTPHITPLPVSTPSPLPVWVAEGGQALAQFGSVVAPAGDVNGDGYSDVIVGAPFYNNGGSGQGRVYVFYGSPTGLSAAPAWTAECDQAGAGFGAAAATAGDVNGDGYSDIIIGASKYDNGLTDQGRALVYYGGPLGLSVTPSWTADGGQAGALFGAAVATAGDVNGDGYSDVIIGASNYTGSQTQEGRAYVYLGGPSGLSATPVWTANGGVANAHFGASVSTAGDINGDGYGDIIVGAPQYNNGEPNEGLAFVYYGSALGPSATPDWIAENDMAGAFLGCSVSTAGDVNGDGYADVIVGASGDSHGETGEGRAYLYCGSPMGLSAMPAWVAESDQAGAHFGYSVFTAGDINGDGYADVIVGAHQYDNRQTNEGRAYVYLGSRDGLTTMPVWIAECGQAGAEFGSSVATAGDINGDGYSDLIIGAHLYDSSQADEGRAYAYYGGPAVLSSTPDYIFIQSHAGSVGPLTTAGDVNGDGYADVIVANGTESPGAVMVFYGSATGLHVAPDWIAYGDRTEAYFGFSVATAGDVNGDGYSDVIIGAPQYDKTDQGRVFIYLGSPTGLSSTPSLVLECGQAGAWFGSSVSSAGDVNGDGYSDVIVGARYYTNGLSNQGRAFVYYGGPSGLSATPNWFADGVAADDLFGYCVCAAGDVNGDGYGDVAIDSVCRGTGDGYQRTIRVYYGSPAGLPPIPSWSRVCPGEQAERAIAAAGDVNGDSYGDFIVGGGLYSAHVGYGGCALVFYGSSAGLSQTPGWFVEGEYEGGRFGEVVSSAGDINGDGYCDVLVSAPMNTTTPTMSGRSYLYLGSSLGLSTAPVWMHYGDPGANWGFVSLAGDINGDGYSDILDSPAYGKPYLYFGNACNGVSLDPRQQRADGSGPIAWAGKGDRPDAFRIAMLGRTPYGHGKVKLETEVKPLGVAFDGSGQTISPAWVETTTSGAELAQVIDGLTTNTLYHWRARLLYHPVSSPYQQISRWLTQPYNGCQEADLRMAGQTIQAPPNTPINVLPANGATQVSLTPLLHSTPFSDPNVGDTHLSSQWQIRVAGSPADYSVTVFDSGASNLDLVTYAVPTGPLAPGTTYYWRVRHRDNKGARSAWSNETAMTTLLNSAPYTPLNIAPMNGAMGLALTPALQSSDFSDPNTSDTHTASQWQVRVSTSPLDYSITTYDSSTDTAHLTSTTVPAGRLNYGMTYYWRVCYEDSYGAWSAWSNPTSFTTVVAPSPTPTPQPTPSRTPHPTPTAHPTPSETAHPSPTPRATPTATPYPTPTPANRPPAAPINQSPGDGATSISLTPALQSSAFSDPDLSDTHYASQWHVRRASDPADWSVTIFNSTTDTANLTSITLVTALDHATTYIWRVRYADNHNAWSAWSAPTQFVTINMAAGTDWILATPTAGWPGRSSHASAIFQGEMWIMGGTNLDRVRNNDVWHSPDGSNWTQATTSATWESRVAMTCVAYDGYLWVMGGFAPEAKNDVWRSADGVAWTRITSNAPWSPRGGMSAVVYDNQMWVLGGSDDTNWFNDVWSSTDGASWTLVKDHAAWPERANGACVVFGGELWVLGGGSNFGGSLSIKNDVWHSANGVDWTQASAAAPWTGRQQFGCVAYNEKLWVLGGELGYLSYVNDVWASPDGANWTQVRDHAEWSARAALAAFVKDERMWVVGGSAHPVYGGDVWYSAPPVNNPPDMPAGILPARGATGVALTPVLQSSAFSDPDTGDTHQASQWQLRRASDPSNWSVIIFNSTTDTANLTSITLVTALDYATTYIWRVRYADNHNAWSAWSNPTSFTTVTSPGPTPTPHPTPSATPNVSPTPRATSSPTPSVTPHVSPTPHPTPSPTQGPVNHAPAQPANLTPVANATSVSLAPTLLSSAFSDPDTSDTHTASQWQVCVSTSPLNFSVTVYDSSTDTAHLTSTTVPIGRLNYNMTYYWRVSYEDSHGAWSVWSNPTSFTTMAAPPTPSPTPHPTPSATPHISPTPRPTPSVTPHPPYAPANLTPAHMATNVTLNAALTASAFSDPHPGDIHAASRWQVRITTGPSDYSAPVFDSGRDTANRTSITLPRGSLIYFTAYSWRVRYQDGAGTWGNWSNETRFTTEKPAPIYPPSQPQNIYPADLASDVPLTATLRSSPFADPNSGDVHTSSQWQIRAVSSPSDYSSTIYDSQGTTLYLTDCPIPAGYLNYNTHYLWRMRHADNTGLWSSWSNETEFITTGNVVDTNPAKPANTDPPNHQAGVSLTPVLIATAFNDPDAGDYQSAAQWRIRTDAGSYAAPVYDSGVVYTDSSRHQVPSARLSGANDGVVYYWQVRYCDSRGAWSDWSDETWFMTHGINTPETPQGLRAASGAKSVWLTWILSSDSQVKGYYIYRSLTLAGPYLKITASAIRGNEYLDNNLPPYQTYYYRISAFSINGVESVWTEPVWAIVGATQIYMTNLRGMPNQIISQYIAIDNPNDVQNQLFEVEVNYDLGMLTPVAVSTMSLSSMFDLDSNVALQPDGTVTVIGSSSVPNAKLSGEGNVLEIKYQVNGSAPPMSRSTLSFGMVDLPYTVDLGTKTVVTSLSILRTTSATMTVANPIQLGDVNRDGSISVSDWETLKQIILGRITPSEEQFEAGDINGDKMLDSADLVLLWRRILTHHYLRAPAWAMGAV